MVDPLPAGWALLLGYKTLTETPLTEDMATHGAHQLTTYTKNLEMENFHQQLCLPRLLMPEKLSRQTGHCRAGDNG